MNVIPAVRFSVRREGPDFVGVITIRSLESDLPNLSIAALALFCLGVLIFYLIGENLPCLAGARISC